MKNELEKLYGEIIEESSLSRLWKKTQEHTCGTITAFRGDKTYEENTRNNKRLLSFLQSKGYSITGIQGTYIENKDSENEKEVNERSFFVCDKKQTGELEDDLFDLGVAFDQDSVLIIPQGGEDAYLLGTSRRVDSYPGYKSKEVVGSGKFGQAAGEFLSKIKGRQFAFEEVREPQTINGKRGQQIMLREMLKMLDG